MTKKKLKPDQKMQAWMDARKRHNLSHAHVQMAHALGMNPKNLGKIDNHKQEPWKTPLPHFIEYLYEKRFGKERPDVVLTIEEMVNRDAEKKARRREARLQRRPAKTSALQIPAPATSSAPEAIADDGVNGAEDPFS